MSISPHIPNDIKRVSRSIGFALWVGTDDQWFGLQTILRVRLTERQRAALAFQTLKSLDPSTASMTANLALGDTDPQPSVPIGPLFDHADEAAFWSDMASSEELEAYCLASFTKMPHGRQVAFLDHVLGRAAA